MRKLQLISIIFILLISSPFCFGQAAPPSVTFKDSGKKPVKKVPETAGNFEVIQGKSVKAPINMETFAKAAKVSLDVLNTLTLTQVTVHSQGKSYIHFRVMRSPAWVDIRLCFWEDEYWYEYIESYKFSAVPVANHIHKNYKSYINRMEADLKKYYK